MLLHLGDVKSWLPRVTVVSPTGMPVVLLISCLRIRCISASTRLIDGRFSLVGFTHRNAKRNNSFMPRGVKPLVILLSAIAEISLDSWKFRTCISEMDSMVIDIMRIIWQRGIEQSSGISRIYPFNNALIRRSRPSTDQLHKEHTKTVYITLYGKNHGLLPPGHATNLH